MCPNKGTGFGLKLWMDVIQMGVKLTFGGEAWATK